MNNKKIDLSYPAWLTMLCNESDNKLVKDSQYCVDSFLNEDVLFPDKYKWKYMSEESFASLISLAKNPIEINKIYWSDFINNCEAYFIMLFWRIAELTKSSLKCLFNKEIISAAVLSRSMLELSSSVLLNANTIDKTLERVSLSNEEIVVSNELELLIAKAIWGSRLEGTRAELKQKNCLTFIEKISKHPEASDLSKNYEVLCEIAHPNVIGNARFWSLVESTNPDGGEIRHIERNTVPESINGIVEVIVWAIAWSTVTGKNGIEIGLSSLRYISKQLSNKKV
jgi:hypothetical protein